MVRVEKINLKGGGGVHTVLFSLKLYKKAKIIPIQQYTSCRHLSGQVIRDYKNDKLVEDSRPEDF
jgi:hypothetical protein